MIGGGAVGEDDAKRDFASHYLAVCQVRSVHFPLQASYLEEAWGDQHKSV